MRVGVYFCRCGVGDEGQISGKIDVHVIRDRIEALPTVDYVETVDFACGEAGQDRIREHVEHRRPDRVVIAACSPRQHEETFRQVLTCAGVNPYLLHLVNIREQIAWVTEDPRQAVDKAVNHIRAGVARVAHHYPLEATKLEACPDVMVIGAGPAGLKAAMTLAKAGRQVILVEKSPILGGLPVRFEEIFPTMECAPCLLEPIIGDVLHGDVLGNIDIHLTSTVTGMRGFLGNFDVTITTAPRHISVTHCVGCGLCIEACPIAVPHMLNLERTERKAVDFELFGGLPSVPVVDESACTRFTAGDDCLLCHDICPVEGAILFDDVETIHRRTVGAIIVAIGSMLYDLSRVENLGYGAHPDILSSWDVERLLAANGPHGGQLVTSQGKIPQRIAIIHCAGSLDPDHVPYCSGICCHDAAKYVHLIQEKNSGIHITSFVRTIVMSGKEIFNFYLNKSKNVNHRWRWYSDPRHIEVRVEDDFRKGEVGPLSVVCHCADSGNIESISVDLVILLAPIVPSDGLRDLANILDIGIDATGFLAEYNARSDATCSSVRGIFIAGACQSPMDIQMAMTQGTAAAGHVLSTVVDGSSLCINPATASVDQERCCGCMTCLPLCPYQAIESSQENAKAYVNSVLCVGCGTCVATCPNGAITGHHCTDNAIYAEIEAALQK